MIEFELEICINGEWVPVESLVWEAREWFNWVRFEEKDMAEWRNREKKLKRLDREDTFRGLGGWTHAQYWELPGDYWRLGLYNTSVN